MPGPARHRAHLKLAGHMTMMRTSQLWRDVVPAMQELASGAWVVAAVAIVVAALLILQANDGPTWSIVWSKVGRSPAQERAIRSFAAAVERGNITAAETLAARVLGANDAGGRKHGVRRLS